MRTTGHVVFTIAMGRGNFWMAIAGEALHGFGSGAVVVAMRAVVSKFFLENELTFALVRCCAYVFCCLVLYGFP